MIYGTTSAYINFVLCSDVLGRFSYLSLYMYVSVVFFRALKTATLVTTAEWIFKIFLQPQNFADPRKTVIPVLLWEDLVDNICREFHVGTSREIKAIIM